MGVVAVGDKIPLSVLIEGDGVAALFVRATLTNHLGVALPESPVNLPHVTANLFQSFAVSMPNSDFVNAQYAAFEDALFTTPSDAHQVGTAGERFDRAKAIEVNAVSVSDSIEGVISDDNLSLVIEDDTLDATINDEALVGTIEDDSLVGVPGEETITGTIGEC